MARSARLKLDINSLKDPLLIIDGDNLPHRAYHSSPKSIRGTNGLPLNAVVGFFGMLLKVVQTEKPRGVFVAWDTLGVDTYRNRVWPPYQGGRRFDAEIKLQLEMLPLLCEALGCGTAKHEGYEADDLMAAAVQSELKNDGVCLVLTTDKDAFQLVSDKTTILSPVRGGRSRRGSDRRRW